MSDSPSAGRTKAQLPALTPRRLSQEIAELIRDRILSGDFQPGERLLEPDLARQLGVSRGPIREALRRLEGEGLVVEETNRGARVAVLTADDVREIYEVRAALETKAAQLLVRRGEGFIRELDPVLARLSLVSDGDDARRTLELDLQFHELLCRLSGNRRLHAAFRANVPILRTILLIDEDAFRSKDPGVAWTHRVIVDAIRRGDDAEIQDVVSAHMASSLARVGGLMRGIRVNEQERDAADGREDVHNLSLG